MSQELTIIDEDKEYYFPIAPQVTKEGIAGKLYNIQTRDWEPADGSLPWRLAIHPWNAGLGPNRVNASVTLGGELKNRPSMSYAKGNVDSAHGTFATFPPAYTLLESSVIASLYLDSVEDLYYDGSMYGGIAYMGAASAGAAFSDVVRNFNGKAYFAGGQYLFSVNSSLALTLVKDFGAGKTIADIEVFNNELVIAMGESEKIWKMDTAESFTQASDNTFAIALGRTNELLWRAETKNLISSCITTPLTLTNWAPASGSQYSAGDTSFSITDLKEYGGSILAIRPDGVFLADGNTDFHNQTPDLATYPDLENGQGSATGWGYFWIPSVIGLIRMQIGEAVVVGPELSERPGFRFRVRAVVPWQNAMYLICTDEEESEETFICKMTRDTANANNPYAYHEWMRMGTTDKGYVIVVYTGATNPTLIAGRGLGLSLTTLGRGSGQDIDDSLYPYGTSMVLEPGLVVATADLGIEIDLIGVKVVGKQVTDGTLTVQHDMDDTGTWRNLESTVDGPGIVPITDEGVFATTRYAQPNVTGHMLYLRILGTMPEGQMGEDRTEIYEIWAWGNSHPETTDIITIDIYSDVRSRVRGLIQGRRKNKNTFRMLRDWCYSSKVVELKIPEYDNGEHVRVVILSVAESNISMTREGTSDIPSGVTRITCRRVDFSGDLNG